MRCAAAVKASKDAFEALEAERDLWSCVRATYVRRMLKLRMSLQNEVSGIAGGTMALLTILGWSAA